MKFKFLEHTADVKIQAFGITLEECFENCALAMFAHMHKGKVKNKTREKIKVQGKDLEALLYNFLEEFLYLLDTKGFFLSALKVKIKKQKNYVLEAELFGDDVNNYNDVNLDVKAITYNEMFVKKQKGKFVVQVVLDV